MGNENLGHCTSGQQGGMPSGSSRGESASWPFLITKNCEYLLTQESQGVLVVKNLLANAGEMRCGFDPWVGKIPWTRAWQPTPVFFPGNPMNRGAW